MTCSHHPPRAPRPRPHSLVVHLPSALVQGIALLEPPGTTATRPSRYATKTLEIWKAGRKGIRGVLRLAISMNASRTILGCDMHNKKNKSAQSWISANWKFIGNIDGCNSNRGKGTNRAAGTIDDLIDGRHRALAMTSSVDAQRAWCLSRRACCTFCWSKIRLVLSDFVCLFWSCTCKRKLSASWKKKLK